MSNEKLAGIWEHRLYSLYMRFEFSPDSTVVYSSSGGARVTLPYKIDGDTAIIRPDVWFVIVDENTMTYCVPTQRELDGKTFSRVRLDN